MIANLIAGGSYSVVVAANSPYDTVEELVDAAKAAPDTITAGIQNGASSHIMTGMLMYDTGAPFKMIEAGTDQEKLAAMQGGHMTFCFLNSKNAKPYTESGDLKILATSPEAGIYALSTESGRQIFITGHSEYDADTREKEYLRDKSQGKPIDVPKDYYPDDDDTQPPRVTWRSCANLLYSNWLNYFVYQTTPFDLGELPGTKDRGGEETTT